MQEELPQLAQRYPGLIYSFEGRTAEQRDSMSALGRGFLFALLGIFALLAIPFRSYIQPLIVMTAIPFGIIGAVAGHLIMGYSLSVISMFGIVALSGVVVNDSLVLIDLANRKRREEGLSVHDAVLASATQRFRPILLTTLTTFLGLSPMILERAMQARFMIPMAISLGFGIPFRNLHHPAARALPLHGQRGYDATRIPYQERLAQTARAPCSFAIGRPGLIAYPGGLRPPFSFLGNPSAVLSPKANPLILLV